MLESGEEGHIVNTASMAGMIAGPGMGPYNATKFAVVAISETLSVELTGTKVGVSVLCPGFVNTDIMTSTRNRPAELHGRDLVVDENARAAFKQLLESGKQPHEVALMVEDAIRNKRLHIFTVVRHDDDSVVATAEHMMLHVDAVAGEHLLVARTPAESCAKNSPP